MSHHAIVAALLSSAVIGACAPPGPTPSAFVGPQPHQAQPGAAASPYASLPPPAVGQPADPYAGGGEPLPGEREASPGAPIGDLSRYAAYATPPGWTEQRSESFITLTGPKCVFHLLAPFPSSASLEETLDVAFDQYFAGFVFMYDRTTYDTVTYGTSAAGWRFRRVEVPLRSTTNPDLYFNALAFAADLGGEVAVVFGMNALGADRCFSERWGIFQDGLAFAGFTDRDDAYRAEIVGTWMAASASAGYSIAYTADGRYDWMGLNERDTRLDDREVLRTTTKYAGDGAWTLRGRTLVLTSDRGGEDLVYRIRIEIQETDRGRERRLCQIKTDAGGEYESCLGG